MNRRPVIADLFCGAGGAAMGYHRAGFDVVGVDIAPQPHYPFEFHQADAMEFPLDGFDAIHASPPCQAYSAATPQERRDAHPDLYELIRDRLRATDVPWVIENVIGAPPGNGGRDVKIADSCKCGTTFTAEGWPHHVPELWVAWLNAHAVCRGDNRTVEVER